MRCHYPGCDQFIKTLCESCPESTYLCIDHGKHHSEVHRNHLIKFLSPEFIQQMSLLEVKSEIQKMITKIEKDAETLISEVKKISRETINKLKESNKSILSLSEFNSVEFDSSRILFLLQRTYSALVGPQDFMQAELIEEEKRLLRMGYLKSQEQSIEEKLKILENHEIQSFTLDKEEMLTLRNNLNDWNQELERLTEESKFLKSEITRITSLAENEIKSHKEDLKRCNIKLTELSEKLFISENEKNQILEQKDKKIKTLEVNLENITKCFSEKGTKLENSREIQKIFKEIISRALNQENEQKAKGIFI